MTDRAWYLRCTAEDVADRAVLVGDRGRVALAARLMEDVELLNEDRGLTTATGTWAGERVTVTAFGMGAPIAAIVMHELADLGVSRFLRLGTAIAVGATELGDFVVSHGAVRKEATSATYLPLEYPAVPDFALTAAVEAAARRSRMPLRAGLYASFDGFYTEMFDLAPGVTTARDGLDELADRGVIAVDMETSALFVAGTALGVAAASLCLASVDGATRGRMEDDLRVAAEEELLRVGLDALTSAAN